MEKPKSYIELNWSFNVLAKIRKYQLNVGIIIMSILLLVGECVCERIFAGYSIYTLILVLSSVRRGRISTRGYQVKDLKLSKHFKFKREYNNLFNYPIKITRYVLRLTKHLEKIQFQTISIAKAFLK
jgi:hypothetical protein